jgi:hypothetical protein
VYHHLERGLVTLVHGDDYATAGNIKDLRWFKQRLEVAYEIKTQIIGPDGDKIGKVLNRVITYTAFGFELKADQRHSEMIVEQLGVTSSGGITTAECKNEEIEGPEQEELLPDADVTLFRGVAARANYLGPDRPDMLYASKEACRKMSKPSIKGLEKMTRIGKFLAGRPRVIWEFPSRSPRR